MQQHSDHHRLHTLTAQKMSQVVQRKWNESTDELLIIIINVAPPPKKSFVMIKK